MLGSQSWRVKQKAKKIKRITNQRKFKKQLRNVKKKLTLREKIIEFYQAGTNEGHWDLKK